MTDTGSEPIYKVDHVEETFGPAGFGQNNRMLRVWLKVVGMDHLTYVDVPYDKFTGPQVQKMADDHVANMIDVHTITPGFS